MPAVTLPKKVKKNNDPITIPRKEYEEFLVLKKYFPVVQPSTQELRAIRQGRKEKEAGNYTPWAKLKHELENRHSRSGKKTAPSASRI